MSLISKGKRLGDPRYGVPCFGAISILCTGFLLLLGWKEYVRNIFLLILLSFPSWEDWQNLMVSDVWSVLIFISGILFVKHSFYTLLISYGILSTFWSLIFIWKKEAVGIGDVLISFAISSWLAPLEVLLFLWSSFAIGGVISIGITLIRGKHEKIPFVPFLSLGGIIAYVWGKEIIFWYASIL